MKAQKNYNINNKIDRNKSLLTCGWIPGSEWLLLKAIIKIILGIWGLIIGYNIIKEAIISGMRDYQTLVDVHVAKLLQESTSVEFINKNIPILETLINILESTKYLKIEERGVYLLKYIEAFIDLINENPNLTENQRENIQALIDYMNELLRKTNQKITNEALEAFKKQIVDKIKEKK